MAGETIRDAVIRIRLEQINKELKVEAGTAGKTVEEFEKKSAKSMGTAEKAARDAEAQQKKLNKEYENAARDVDEYGKKQVESNLKAADSFKTLAEGTFTVVRGLTLMGVAGEEDMQKVVQGVAQAQATFDLFKGSLDIVKGFVEGVDALRTAQDAAKASTAAAATVEQLKTVVTVESATASSAAAAAGTAQAAANTAVGTTATGAAAGMTALQIATGPVGVTFLAVSAAIAGLVFYLRSLNDSEERNRRLEEDAITRRRRLADETERLKRVSQSAAEREGFLSHGDAQASRQKRLSGVGEDLARVSEGRRGFEELIARRREQIDQLKELEDLEVRLGKARTQPLSSSERERINSLRRQFGSGTSGAFRSVEDLSAQRADLQSANVRTSQLLVTASEQEAALIEQKKKLIEDIGRADIRSLENRRAELEAQKSLVSETRAEARERYQLANQLRSQEESLQLRLLDLKGGARSRAIADIKTLTSDSASDRDKLRATERLGTSGISLREGEDVRLREAGRLGLDDVTGRTSLRSEREKALREGDAAAERATAFAADIASKTREVERRIAESNEQLSNSMTTILDTMLSQAERIAEIENLARKNEDAISKLR